MSAETKPQRLHIELSRVQTWLFAVPRLRAMVGANALLGETLRVALPKMARETARGWVLAPWSTSSSTASLRLFELLPRHPIVTIASATKLLETTKPTAIRAVELLVSAGVLVEQTGKKRDRSFAYSAYLDRLKVGTELARPPK